MASVLITGGDGLIGSALARHLEGRGHVVCTIDREEQSGYFDMTSQDHVDLLKHAWDVDVLVNCFAYNDHVRPGERRGTVLDLDPEVFASCMDVNVTALFRVCQAYARARLGRGGCIVNFGASTGIVSARTDMYGGQHKNIGYSVSKAAVIHMTRILATHLVTLDPGMRVNCISPGGVESDQSDEFKALYGSHTPAGRMCRVEELFPAVDMLIDPLNTYMQGANVVVDGGWTVQ